MKIALITLSDEGARLLAPLTGRLPEARLFIHESVRDESIRCETVLHETARQDSAPHEANRSDPDRSDSESELEAPAAERFTKIADLTAALFPVCRGLVYAAPCGVVVRALAPLVKSKYEDPAVVVLDAGGRWAVSLLSGHEGGANDLAIRVANLTGAEPVVTTTTEALKSVIVGIGCRRGRRRRGSSRPSVKRSPKRELPWKRSAFSPRRRSRRTRRGFSRPRRRSAFRSASSPRKRYGLLCVNFRIPLLWKKR